VCSTNKTVSLDNIDKTTHPSCQISQGLGGHIAELEVGMNRIVKAYAGCRVHNILNMRLELSFICCADAATWLRQVSVNDLKLCDDLQEHRLELCECMGQVGS